MSWQGIDGPASRPRNAFRGLIRQDFCSQLLSLFVSTIHEVRRSVIALGHRLMGLTLSHGPRTTAHGPLLQGRETRLTDRFPVTRLVLLQQAVAH